MSQYGPSWCKSAALLHCLACGRYKCTIGDIASSIKSSLHYSWNWWDICHQLITVMCPVQKTMRGEDGWEVKGGLLWPPFPPRQWPVLFWWICLMISCSCSALKACKLRNCSCRAAHLSCIEWLLQVWKSWGPLLEPFHHEEEAEGNKESDDEEDSGHWVCCYRLTFAITGISKYECIDLFWYYTLCKWLEWSHNLHLSNDTTWATWLFVIIVFNEAGIINYYTNIGIMMRLYIFLLYVLCSTLTLK